MTQDLAPPPAAPDPAPAVAAAAESTGPIRLRDRWRGLLIAARVWRRSRTHRLVALLGLLGVLALGAVLTAAAWQSPLELQARYARWAQRAEQAGQWQAASLYYQRCLTLAPYNHGARYGLALVSDRLGDVALATALMTELAQGTSTAEPAARLWLVQRLLPSGARPSPEQLAAVQPHLERLVQLQPTNLAVQENLARVYASRGLVAKAIDQFRQLGLRQPSAYLSLAALLRNQGQIAASEESARRAVEALERRLAQEPRDLEALSGLATAHVLLTQYESAEQVLHQALALSQDPALKRALANVYLTHDRARSNDPGTTLGDRVRWLSAALELVPGHPEALASLARLSGVEGPEAEQASSRLKQALAEGQAPAVVHLILGNQAFDRGRLQEARLHLDQALALDPKLAVVANNLAWVLFQSDRSQAERALELVNRAIELDASDPEFRATRGMILAHKGRWPEAVIDLERALTSDARRPDLHQALAEAYEHLGDPELAARHRGFSSEAGTEAPPR